MLFRSSSPPQCGHAGQEHISSFTRVGGALLDEKVVAAGCGITFSLFLCESGKVFAVGSGEKGQLGNGKVQVTPPASLDRID